MKEILYHFKESEERNIPMNINKLRPIESETPMYSLISLLSKPARASSKIFSFCSKMKGVAFVLPLFFFAFIAFFVIVKTNHNFYNTQYRRITSL